MPAAGKPTFALGEDEMEMGVGIHGEPGRRRVKLLTADAIAAEMMTAIMAELEPAKKDGVLLSSMASAQHLRWSSISCITPPRPTLANAA